MCVLVCVFCICFESIIMEKQSAQWGEGSGRAWDIEENGVKNCFTSAPTDVNTVVLFHSWKVDAQACHNKYYINLYNLC